MLICVKSKHGCSSGMMSWNVIVMRLVCKDSNNVDSEIHYFKDGSIPLFCSVDFFGCLQGDITVHHILSNFMMLLCSDLWSSSLYQLFLLICALFPHFSHLFSRICAHFVLTFSLSLHFQGFSDFPAHFRSIFQGLSDFLRVSHDFF